MSTAKSPFIEASKHQGLSSMVEDHVMGSGRTDATGMTPEAVKGYNGQNALPAAPKDLPFNMPDTGVNYVAPDRAGHGPGDLFKL